MDSLLHVRFAANDSSDSVTVDHLFLLENTGNLVERRFVSPELLERGLLGPITYSWRARTARMTPIT